MPRRPSRSISSLLRLKIILAVVAVTVLAVSGCTAKGADEPTRTGSGDGYVGARSLTQVASDDRKAASVISGRELGQDKEIATDSYQGKVVVLNVWGSWCAPCRFEAPDLRGASEETTDVAQFVGVNTRDLTTAPALAFERAFETNYPSIYDPQGKELLKFAGDLPPAAIPSTLIIDKEGRIAARILGPISKITLVDLINDVAEGR